MPNLVCIGGKLDGRTYNIDQTALDSGGVTLADIVPIFRAGQWKIDNSVELGPTEVRSCRYLVGSLYFPGPWRTTNKIQYLHSPDIDGREAMLLLLSHYATKEQKDDAQQP